MAYLFGLPGNDQTLDHAPKFKRRLDQHIRRAKNIVLVGWRPTPDGVRLFDAMSPRAAKTLVEAWPSNCERFSYRDTEVVCGDIREYNSLPFVKCGMLIWQDGPEHVVKEEVVPLIMRMQEDFNAIVLSTPDGEHPQEALEGNPWEIHRSTWREEDYERLGFQAYKYNAGLLGLWEKRM